MIKSRRHAVAALVLGGLALAAGVGLWAVRPILAPFLLAVAIAYLIEPLVAALCQLGLSRGWAIVAVYVLLLLAGALAVGKLLPEAVAEIRRLMEAIPVYSGHVRALMDSLQQRILGLPPDLREMVDRAITDLESASLARLRRLLELGAILHAAELLLSLLLAPFLAYYLLKDIERFKERFVQALPSRYRQHVLCLLRGLDQVLAGFVRGQLLLALAVGSLAGIATALLGIRYALLLGIWAGLTEMVPYAGPILGAVPAVLAGLSVSPLTAVQVAVAFLLIQQIENAVLSPKILGERVGLHPLVVMFAVLSGGYLAGPWGLVLALPVAGLVRVVWCFVVARLTDAPEPPEAGGRTVAAPPRQSRELLRQSRKM